MKSLSFRRSGKQKRDDGAGKDESSDTSSSLGIGIGVASHDSESEDFDYTRAFNSVAPSDTDSNVEPSLKEPSGSDSINASSICTRDVGAGVNLQDTVNESSRPVETSSTGIPNNSKKPAEVSRKRKYLAVAVLVTVVALAAAVGIGVGLFATKDNTDDSGTKEGPIKIFSPFAVTVNIGLDVNPEETGWSLVCTDGVHRNSPTVFADYKPGDYYEPNKVISKTYLVEEGGTCTFNIVDTYDDGICCSNGEGFYRIYYGKRSSNPPLDHIIAEGGEFGNKEDITFDALKPEEKDDATETPQIEQPTRAPTTRFPTATPEVGTPTPAPQPGDSVAAIIRKVALRGGEEFQDSTSYQSLALNWLESNRNLHDYSPEQVIQRYALGCIFFSTTMRRNSFTDTEYGEGAPVPGWKFDDNWVTNAHECTWYGVRCDVNRRVASLNLPSNRLSGSFPQEVIFLRKALQDLDLSDNLIHNAYEENNFLGDLQELTNLDLSFSYFENNGIPPAIGKLSYLEVLDLSHTLYHGALEGSIFGNMPFLYQLELGGIRFDSSVPAEISQLPSLENLYMEGAHLTGTLDFISEMPKIFELWIDRNDGLEGGIPTTIGLAKSLRSLSITNCNLTGKIPTEIGRLTDMRQMWLFSNSLEGRVPTEIGFLTSMSKFDVSDNDISGKMPAEVCRLTYFGILGEGLTADCISEVDCDCCTACF